MPAPSRIECLLRPSRSVIASTPSRVELLGRLPIVYPTMLPPSSRIQLLVRLPPRTPLLVPQLPQPRGGLFCFPGQQSGVVGVGVADEVFEKSGVWFGRGCGGSVQEG